MPTASQPKGKLLKNEHLAEDQAHAGRLKLKEEKQTNKGTIAVVVAGTEVFVEYNINEPLNNVVNKALQETGNASRKQEDWQLKYNGLEITDWSQKVSQYGLPPTAVLYLSLREGVLG
jgi:hypothetical protein